MGRQFSAGATSPRTITVSPFTPGQTTPVTVTATKTDPAMQANVAIGATNRLGSITELDPAVVTIHGTGEAGKTTLSDIPSAEHVLLVANGDPGLNAIEVLVNARTIKVLLKPGEKRTINLKAWMRRADNTVGFSGEGRPDQVASVVLKN
jgi:hypothetical protein